MSKGAPRSLQLVLIWNPSIIPDYLFQSLLLVASWPPCSLNDPGLLDTAQAWHWLSLTPNSNFSWVATGHIRPLCETSSVCPRTNEKQSKQVVGHKWHSKSTQRREAEADFPKALVGHGGSCSCPSFQQLPVAWVGFAFEAWKTSFQLFLLENNY